MAKKSAKKVMKASSKKSSDGSKFPVVLGSMLLLFGVAVIAAFFIAWGDSFGASIDASVTNVVKIFNMAMLKFFGHVSVLVFGVALLLLSIFSFTKFERVVLLRIGIGFTLLTVVLSYLFSLRVYDVKLPSPEQLVKNGGILGNALSKELAQVFGSSVILPSILGIVALVGVCAACFGLRARHFKFLVIIAKVLWKIPVGIYKFREARKEAKLQAGLKKEFVAIETPESKPRRGRAALPAPAQSVNWDDTVIGLPQNAKPFKAAGVWGTAMGSLPPLNEPIHDASTIIPAVSERPENRLEALERELKERGPYLDDVEKRKIRDEIAELRRIRKVNEWEDANEELPNVQGIVRGKVTEQVPVAIPVVGETAEHVAEPVAAEETTEIGNNEMAFVTVGASGVDADLETTNIEELKPEVAVTEEVAEETESAEPASEFPVETYRAENAAQAIDVFADDSRTIDQTPQMEYDPYVIPDANNVLDEAPEQSPEYSEDELQVLARELELHLESYKVKGKVTNIVTGPVITRFEVEPGPGIKVAKFLSLQDDLALALKAISIRILAPIPGKSVVGIEIPNRKSQTIFCSDLFCAEHFTPATEKLQIVLGKDITGAPFTMDLARAPHLLIAGQTGSGKSVCINVLMASLLLSKTPDELRLVLVDPKVVELKMYESIPHLLHPVITQPDVAVQALKWLCVEMDRRYEVLAKAKVRNLFGYNEKVANGTLPDEVPEEERKKMAFIVVVIDELADLMMVAGKEVEKSIARIAQKARAVGIHLVLATQRPSANVITGLIKANLPTRISFKVGSALDSRIILDMQGAEKLLGRGDMLYKLNDDPVRVHGAFLSDPEAERLADACSNQNVYYPQLESFEFADGDSEDEDGDDGLPASTGKVDPLLFQVALWAVGMRGVSVSAVQRAFSVGFSRAGKIVDQMEKFGICGKSKGNSKPRDMLMGEEEINNLSNRF